MRAAAMRALLLAALLCAATTPARAFYLPGVAPQDFARDDLVNFKVNSLTSDRTPVPMRFYDLPYCRPSEIRASAENLGEVLRGDRIFNSLYQMQMRLDERCKVMCESEPLSEHEADRLRAAIVDGYRVNMILDNLPAAQSFVDDAGVKRYDRGFPVGFVDEMDAKRADYKDARAYVNNHATFTILYHKDESRPDSARRIVGFEVEPHSVKHRRDPNATDPSVLSTCDPERVLFAKPPARRFDSDASAQVVAAGEKILWTYDVAFKPSDVRWASRWDTYLAVSKSDEEIHWFSVINSAVVMLFLSAMVAMIVLRTLRSDITRYNALESVDLDADDDENESGWKLLHGDVFRPPRSPARLAVCVGTGAQLILVAFVTMVFALLGFLSPANRGGLMTASLMTFALAGVAAGYVAGRMFRAFQLSPSEWRRNTAHVAVAFPGLAFAVLISLNLMVWGKEGAAAVPFGTLFQLCAMWFCLSTPLVFLGSHRAFAAPAPEQPTRTNKIPRQVPRTPWYLKDDATALLGGILPFGAVFIELFFILSSVWLHQAYYIFGVLSVVYVILVVTCAEIAIVITYFTLCGEDYRWWWKAFNSPAFAGAYVFAYSAYYYLTRLDISGGVIPTAMYFSYMGLASIGFGLACGAVGFVASYAFVRAIYGSVKID